MLPDKGTFLGRFRARISSSWAGRHFLNKNFFHYLWSGGFFTFLNIFFVWLFIDIFEIPTIISSTVVIGGLFIARYLVYRWLKIM